MATRDTIVIGASAGGVQALLNLVADLPPNLAAAVFIVQHIPTEAPSMLPEILGRTARAANFTRAVRLFERRAEQAETHSSTIRQLLLSARKADMAESALQT